jgi:hypothetical protein
MNEADLLHASQSAASWQKSGGNSQERVNSLCHGRQVWARS